MLRSAGEPTSVGWPRRRPLRPSASTALRRSGSILTPGPIVGDSDDLAGGSGPWTTPAWPAASSSRTARKLAVRASGSKLDLADRHVDVAVAVGAVLDLAALELADGLADVGGDGAGLGVRHQATGAEHPAELADQRHQVGGGDGDVEVEHAALDLGGEVVGADEVGTGVTGGGRPRRRRRTRRRGRPCRCPTGRATVPRTIWSALRGSTPRRTDELDGLVELGRRPAASPGRAPRRGVQLVADRTASRRRCTSCPSPCDGSLVVVPRARSS